MTNNKTIFQEYEERNCGEITVADGTCKESYGKGSVNLIIDEENQKP